MAASIDFLPSTLRTLQEKTESAKPALGSKVRTTLRMELCWSHTFQEVLKCLVKPFNKIKLKKISTNTF